MDRRSPRVHHAARRRGRAAGQDYPTRSITLIVNFPPGGSTDATARIIREPLSQALGQSIIIDNRGGAGGTTGAAAVANAKPDGYTLLLSVNSALTTDRYLQKNFPFDPKTAFAPITLTSDVALVLAVHPSLPVHDVSGLIEYARKNPGKLAYATPGIGSSHHICGELLKQKVAAPPAPAPISINRSPGATLRRSSAVLIIELERLEVRFAGGGRAQGDRRRPLRARCQPLAPSVGGTRHQAPRQGRVAGLERAARALRA